MVYLLYRIILNVGEIVISYWRYFKNQGGMLLLFPSLKTKLYKRAKVEGYVKDTWVHPSSSIFPLKFWGRGAQGQSKKKNMELGKSIQ